LYPKLMKRSSLEPLSDSTVQPFNDSTVQRFNGSTAHPFNDSTVQPFVGLIANRNAGFYSALETIVVESQAKVVYISKPVSKLLKMVMTLEGDRIYIE
jgi:hypothetical protein